MLYNRLSRFLKQNSKPGIAAFIVSFYVVISLLRLSDIQYHHYEFRAVDQTADVLRRFDPTAPKRNIIAYVTKTSGANILAKSITKLFENFNRKYRYPVVVFYETPANVSFFYRFLVQEKGLDEEDYKLLEFIPITFKLPDEFIRRHGKPGYNSSYIPVFRHIFPGYHHALNFWFQRIFNEPIMQNVGYVWRLDADSYIESPINYDLFDYMAKHHYLYGYRLITSDELFVTVGMWDFVEEFLEKYHIEPVKGQMPDFPPGRNSFERRNFRVPMYYNNFEIVHVPTFQRHRGIKTFAKEVVDSLKIYEQRWGDAPLRYLSVNIFLDRTRYVHEFCDINYYHQAIYTPTCPAPEK